ncbi:hypothetical protein [Cupriavidus sp. SK-3]|uniref:hypothetical protein n=1 Tax=Cupriavidus sp. SK-3 TaxID=1470558 RepID=UPI00126928E1|nr:hypothetical protein [Cupriavidus sp. SK-3]
MATASHCCVQLLLAVPPVVAWRLCVVRPQEAAAASETQRDRIPAAGLFQHKATQKFHQYHRFQSYLLLCCFITTMRLFVSAVCGENAF